VEPCATLGEALAKTVVYYAGNLYDAGTLRRKVISVNDPGAPYLIDFNMAYQLAPEDLNSPVGYQFVMSYHGHSNSLSPRPSQNGYARWNNVGGTSGDLFLYPGDVDRDVYTNDAYMVHGDAARESGNVSIQRLDIQSHNGPGEDNLTPYHTTVAFIKAFPNGAPSSIAPPQQWDAAPLDPGVDRMRQAWTWQIDSNTIDVFAARSGIYYTFEGQITRTNWTINVGQANGMNVVLPANKDYGLVRLVKQGSSWSAASDYLLHFNVQQPAPLSASVNGPASLQLGEDGRWYANVSGGKAPYSYAWEYMLDLGDCGPGLAGGEIGTRDVNQCEWHEGGSGSSFTRSVSADATLKIRLTVNDDEDTEKIANKTVWIGSGGGGPFGSTQNKQNASAAKQATPSQVEALPQSYELAQNYPNPFNPSTDIRFALPEGGPVSLVVYDMMGRRVKHLVNGTLPAGYHEVSWNAREFPSGVYLYQLTAGDFIETRRMVLLR